MSAANLAGHLQRFFTDRLLGQLGASPHTIASYRDTFRLLLRFASKYHRRQASDLKVEDLDAKLVGAFLKHLEHDRRNSARSRNSRLSAIHAFFAFVCLNEPALASHCQQVLAMPFKRFERGPVEFLTREETTALLNAPDTSTWLGRRDQLLLEVAVQTGLRNSELTKLQRQDVQLGAGAHAPGSSAWRRDAEGGEQTGRQADLARVRDPQASLRPQFEHQFHGPWRRRQLHLHKPGRRFGFGPALLPVAKGGVVEFVLPGKGRGG